MANENYKIGEAEFFLEKLRGAILSDNLTEVKYYSSAFSSSARSILQYAIEEICPERYSKKRKKRTFPLDCSKPNAKQWYDKQMENDYFKVFKNFRDENIHRSPFSVEISCTVSVGTFDLNLSTGDVVYTDSKIDSFYRYSIKGWQGEKALDDLCTNYLEKLREFVAKGIAEGYITG